MENGLTRKEFLQQLAFLGFAAIAGGSVLSGCGQKEETPKTGTTAGGTETRTASRPASDDPCTDVSGLTDAELKMRNETLKYVAASPDPEKVCDNCKFWQPPEAGQTCGSCQLVKGPINPKGYCTSWFTAEG